MPETPKAANVIRLLREAGAQPYAVMSGQAHTSKVMRLVMPNAVPIVVEIDRKTPNVWLLPRHERNAFRLVGKSKRYEAGKGRHHHLNQVREFVDQELLKIPVTTEHWENIRDAIKAVVGPRRTA